MTESRALSESVPVLIGILRNHEDDKWLVEEALGCLSILCALDFVKEAIVASKGVDILSSIHKKYKGEISLKAKSLLGTLNE